MSSHDSRDRLRATVRSALAPLAFLVIAAPAEAQVTSTAVAAQPVRIAATVGIDTYRGTLPAGPKPNGYSLRVPFNQTPWLGVSAELIPRGTAAWRIVEGSPAPATTRDTSSGTGGHQTVFEFAGGPEPVAGVFEVSLRAFRMGTAAYGALVTLDGTRLTLTPNGPATVVPLRIEAGQRVRVVAWTSTSASAQLLSLSSSASLELDIGFRETPNPCTVIDVGTGCGSTEFDAFGDPSDPSRQILRVRDVTAGPLVAAVVVGAARQPIPLGIHPNTGQPCTVWTQPLQVVFVPLVGSGAAEIAFDAALASGVDLVLQAATMDPAAVLSLSRGLRVRCP
jgi:hypothetical protein